MRHTANNHEKQHSSQVVLSNLKHQKKVKGDNRDIKIIKVLNLSINFFSLMGYKNAKSFTRIFKKYTGITPYQFVEKIDKEL